MQTVHANRRDAMINRFIENGFEGFSREEALELLFFYLMPSESMTGAVNKLFKDYPDLAAVTNAPTEKLIREYGISENAAIFLHTLPEIVSKYKKSDRSEHIESVSAAIEFFRETLKYAAAEKLMACFLSDSLKIVGCETVSTGDTAATASSPLALIEAANKAGSKNIIIAHNHPSQSAQIGEADIAATRIIKRALKEVGIDLLDHIIVSSDGSAVSMKNEGYFPLLDK